MLPFLGTLVVIARLALPVATANVAASFVCFDDGSPQDAKRRDAFHGAARVFVGEVVELNHEEAVFSVEQVWKGPASAFVTMATGSKTNGDGTITWSAEDFRYVLHARYLIYAYARPDLRLGTSVCDRSMSADKAISEMAELGRLSKPTIVKRGS